MDNSTTRSGLPVFNSFFFSDWRFQCAREVSMFMAVPESRLTVTNPFTDECDHTQPFGLVGAVLDSALLNAAVSTHLKSALTALRHGGLCSEVSFRTAYCSLAIQKNN
jgi:hypothetical protein